MCNKRKMTTNHKTHTKTNKKYRITPQTTEHAEKQKEIRE